eukprot:TRINITY_DN44522_c0_g1_i1.p1 TRINITY_DN44522_c0_g1~~TRINITY_DN44522_c0_g1_i1.p1  ORF type:complete len:424 (+),score=134.41 TRINITY_DN44522_c0_g1_i1:61-1272(+)
MAGEVARLPALVIGGGVAGMSAARALTRVGIHPLVIERNRPKCFKPRGLGIWDAARRCLDLLGVGGEFARCSRLIPPAGYRSQTGNWLSTAPDTELNKERVSTVKEADLQQLLSHGISVSERTVIGVSPGSAEERARVRLEGGGELETDLLVVADGARSEIRRRVFGVGHIDTQVYCISGLAVFGAEMEPPFETLGVGPSGTSRFAVVPLPGKEVLWSATFERAPGPSDGSLARPMLGQYRDWHFPIPQIAFAASSAVEDIVEEPVVILADRLESTAIGRTVLVGDAAHPLPPSLAQGASVAIEDAVELAAALKSHCGAAADDGEKVVQALEAFAANGCRRRRVAACRRVTKFTDLLASHPTAAEVLRFVPKSVNSSAFNAFLNYSLTGSLAGRGYQPPATLA